MVEDLRVTLCERAQEAYAFRKDAIHFRLSAGDDAPHP